MHCRSDLQGRHCCHARWQQAMLDVLTASALRGLSILTGCRSVLPTGHHLRQGAVASTAPSCAGDCDSKIAMLSMRAFKRANVDVRSSHGREHDLVMAYADIAILERSSWQTCSYNVSICCSATMHCVLFFTFCCLPSVLYLTQLASWFLLSAHPIVSAAETPRRKL